MAVLVGCAHQPEPRSDAPTPPVQVGVAEAEGLPAERVQTIFAPAATPLAQCLPGRTGKIAFRVTGHDRVLRVSAAPSLSLSDASRNCAANTLSAIYLEQTGSNAGGPAVPPSGFTALLTVAW